MLSLKYYPFELEFEYPFTISKGTKTHQPTLIVSLGLGNLQGFGEAPAIAYYGVTVDGMLESLKAREQIIKKYALTDPYRFWHFLEHLLPGQNFLIAALDIAGWDLFGRIRRKPVYQLLGLDIGKAPITDYTIGWDTPEKMEEKLLAHPSPVYKIKIRKPEDIDVLRKLRSVTDKPFRIDANESLSFELARQLLPEWEKLGVDLIEQPLPRGEREAMKELKKLSSIPFFADESCAVEQDVPGCADGFHGINIKLTKCGGITPALRMIKEARKLGLKIMLGSMNESIIGTAALAHLMPLVDELDADGPLLLKEEVGSGLIYDQGLIRVAEAPGLGTQFFGEKRLK